jgi:hypothetical protein
MPPQTATCKTVPSCMPEAGLQDHCMHADVCLTCCIVLHPPAWHLLPVPLTQCVIKELS